MNGSRAREREPFESGRLESGVAELERGSKSPYAAHMWVRGRELQTVGMEKRDGTQRPFGTQARQELHRHTSQPRHDVRGRDVDNLRRPPPREHPVPAQMGAMKYLPDPLARPAASGRPSLATPDAG